MTAPQKKQIEARDKLLVKHDACHALPPYHPKSPRHKSKGAGAPSTEPAKPATGDDEDEKKRKAEVAEEAVAATKLQAIQRGKARKQSLMMKKGAAEKLQSMYRGQKEKAEAKAGLTKGKKKAKTLENLCFLLNSLEKSLS